MKEDIFTQIEKIKEFIETIYQEQLNVFLEEIPDAWIFRGDTEGLSTGEVVKVLEENGIEFKWDAERSQCYVENKDGIRAYELPLGGL